MAESLGEAREKRAGLRGAMGEVERLLASPAAGRQAAWVKCLGEGLDELDAALSVHIKVTEAPDGLLADIVSTAPHLAHRCDTIRGEHERLRYLMATARESLPADAGGDVQACRERVVELLGGIVRHRHMGAELVYEAFNVDIEAAD